LNDPKKEGNDYINANLICSEILFETKYSYIATQAPLPNTFEDFWRMIFERNTNIIIMLAEEEDEKETFLSVNVNFYIKKTIKAHRYWPKLGKEETYGDFIVINETEQVFNDLIIHEFYLTNTITDVKRKIYFFKYIGWPDMDIPENTNSIKRILNKIDRIYLRNTKMGPIAVHCSAGNPNNKK
jgi:protein tyrosine phosphatase